MDQFGPGSRTTKSPASRPAQFAPLPCICAVLYLSSRNIYTMATNEAYMVVGGCGFLGRHIVEMLLARGEQNVSVFDIVQRHFDRYVSRRGTTRSS